ncbi:MAG: phage integrase N-terminal SAM-like domain-containing protein [Microcoleus vaginatus WJT46-NPBG5]|jgi:hypothetical protein|nr:phage integrase N-terminal SAM-like domain-containing protein [Microcoleus vaginatus WJT46-NPBG5]
MEQRPKKLLEQVQDVIRLKHYSYQTEKTYIYWIRRYILFHNKHHPKDMASKEIEEFLHILLSMRMWLHQRKTKHFMLIFSLQRGIKTRFRFESRCSLCKEI